MLKNFICANYIYLYFFKSKILFNYYINLVLYYFLYIIKINIKLKSLLIEIINSYFYYISQFHYFLQINSFYSFLD